MLKLIRKYQSLQFRHRILVKGASAATIILALLVLALHPVFLGDGSSRYEGNSKLAAQTALEEINRGSGSGLDSLGNIGVLSRRVTAVSKETPPSGGIFSKCKDLYLVSVEDVGWFGRQLKAGDRAVCLD